MSPPASTVILGTGSYAPARVLTNAELALTIETSDEWIRTRSGIRERHIAAPGETTSDMAVHAARLAIADAKLQLADIDLLIVATITPDLPMPATACIVQHKLGLATSTACFDLNAACSGFIYALDTASAMIGSGRYRHALVIGAEKLSSIVDWKDRTTCVLFGDGAGAVVVGASTQPKVGLLGTKLGAYGDCVDLLCIPGGGSNAPATAAARCGAIFSGWAAEGTARGPRCGPAPPRRSAANRRALCLAVTPPRLSPIQCATPSMLQQACARRLNHAIVAVAGRAASAAAGPSGPAAAALGLIHSLSTGRPQGA
jgi:hypothetical protein